MTLSRYAPEPAAPYQARLLTIDEAAERLSLSPATLSRHVSAGRLRAFRIADGDLRVRRADVERFSVPVEERAR